MAITGDPGVITARLSARESYLYHREKFGNRPPSDPDAPVFADLYPEGCLSSTVSAGQAYITSKMGGFAQTGTSVYTTSAGWAVALNALGGTVDCVDDFYAQLTSPEFLDIGLCVAATSVFRRGAPANVLDLTRIFIEEKFKHRPRLKKLALARPEFTTRLIRLAGRMTTARAPLQLSFLMPLLKQYAGIAKYMRYPVNKVTMITDFKTGRAFASTNPRTWDNALEDGMHSMSMPVFTGLPPVRQRGLLRRLVIDGAYGMDGALPVRFAAEKGHTHGIVYANRHPDEWKEAEPRLRYFFLHLLQMYGIDYRIYEAANIVRDQLLDEIKNNGEIRGRNGRRMKVVIIHPEKGAAPGAIEQNPGELQRGIRLGKNLMLEAAAAARPQVQRDGSYQRLRNDLAPAAAPVAAYG
jgi:hypothetical protein